MRVFVCVLALAIFGGFLAAPAWSALPKARPDKKKPDPARLKGMKAAVVDIEAGKLKLKFPPLPASLEHVEYVQLLKKECGVDQDIVRDHTGKAGVEMVGYNDVMTVEIEHRFGKGILAKLGKRAVKKAKERK